MNALSSAERDVLTQLFLNGPTQDGDLCSKAARDELVEYGLARRCNGWNFLSASGVAMGLDGRLGDRKESRDLLRARQFCIAADDDDHHYLIPLERRRDWEVFVDQLMDTAVLEPVYETPLWAHRLEGELHFSWPVVHGEALVDRIGR